jgi:alkylhydroperoxidase/carboxymuconolactone decarboxylase family protein YurZ
VGLVRSPSDAIKPLIARAHRKGLVAMSEETPVLDTLVGITAVSVEQGTLDAHEHMLARLAALVSVDAPSVSYLLNLGTAADAGVTVEDVQGVLIAVAPIVGTPRVVSAAANISEAFGFALAIAEAEILAESDALADAGAQG